MPNLFSSRLLAALLFLAVAACQGPAKNEPATSAPHARLIKTIGNPDYGNVQCIWQDRAGHLWMGTTENGLYRYDGQSFRQYLMADGLPSNDVYALLEDRDGQLWIGTKAGLCLYQPGSTGGGSPRFTPLPIPLPPGLPPNQNPQYQNSHWVFHMLQAKNGAIWLATIDGVYVYEAPAPGQPPAFRLFALPDSAKGFLTTNGKVERMLEDREGNLWFGSRTNPGVYRYDGQTLTHFALDTLYQNGPRPKPHTWGWPQLQDKNGHIWFSSWGGAYRYDGQRFTPFGQADGLPGIVTTILEDKSGHLWFGGEGLCRYQPGQPPGQGKSFTCFGAQQGLANPGVWSLLQDREGMLWVGTRATSLFRFDGQRFEAWSAMAEKVVP